MKKTSKNTKSNIVLVMIFILGLCLLLYPSVSNWWNSFHSTQAIASYEDAVANLDVDESAEMRERAIAYNETLIGKESRFILTEEEMEEYLTIMDATGTGIMGYVEIPSIDVSLPIYHTVEESVLQIASGHIPGSSLPVGGASTHCVLSGHRGLPSAKLFTNLDELVEGDIFLLHILDDTLTYEVDQIRIVEPDELEDLEIESGKDLCTLVTCTPYGINTHRLLVRGHRVETDYSSSIRVTADAVQVDTVLVAIALAVPILVVLMIWVLVFYRKKK